MKSVLVRLIWILTTLSLSLLSNVSDAADLEIRVRGIQDKPGNLLFALFEVRDFLKKPIQVNQSTLAEAKAVLKNITPGSYAVVVFQDINGNGELDRNLFGAPTEPLGFSNDAAAKLGPPHFEETAIKILDDKQSIVITLR